MSQVSGEIISSLKNVRSLLASLQPDNNDSIIKIGVELEQIATQTPAELTLETDLLMLCLGSLQAIFENQVADFPALVRALTSALVAVEQSLNASPNTISEEMLRQAQTVLNNELSGGAAAASGAAPESEIPETEETQKSSSKVLTLDDISSLLVFIEPEDKDQLTQICDSLKALSSQEIASGVKKLLTKAARETAKILNGKSADAAETLSLVAEIVEQINTEILNQEFQAAGSTKNVVRETAKNVAPAAQTDEPEIAEAETTVKKPTPVVQKADAHVAAAVNLEPDVLQADADLALLSEFSTESSELIEAAEVALLALETDPDNLENVNTVFRAFHTIKGSAAFLGLKRLTELAHLAESLLSRIRDREIRCTGGYADLALRSADALKEMLGSVQTALDGGAMVLPASYADLIHVLTAPEAAGVTGESSQAFNKSGAAKEVAQADGDQTESTIEKSGAPQLKIAEPAANASANAAVQRQKSETSDSSVRVRTDRLDSLIDMVGELVIAQSMLAQDATSLGETHLELARKIMHSGKIVRELQDLSMAMRMVPLKATFQKMARVVRDVAQKCGKQVEFVTEGEDTEIDRNLVDIIADPLVHMVRNAVDHGVELPETREASGKPKTGKVRLAAYHAGGNVVVELVDDGKGLDSEKLLEKAISKGLVEPDKKMSESEIFNLIFAPGFSTADQITDVSGRGVGMDVVRRNIEAMRGRVEISSVKGHGSTFTIRLPLTLAITDGMLVRIGSERFIVPTVNIHLSFRPTPSMISSVSGRGEMVLLRGELLPIYRLHRLFDVKNAIEDPTQGLLMIIADGRRRCALLGDELLGQQQVVAKSLGRGINKVQGVSGGAILADGRVGLILDTAEIVALARQTANANDRKDSAWASAA